MRTHKQRIEAERSSRNVSAEQVRREKCERSRTRQEAERKARRFEARNRQLYWEGLTTDQKLAALDKRPGNCAKQRKRLAETE